MPTLIAVYNEHACIGKCDEQCYDAVKPGCTCICNGINHGVGFHKALHNTALHCARWVHKDHFPPDAAPPTAVQIHPDVAKVQTVLDVMKGPLYLMRRKPE